MADCVVRGDNVDIAIEEGKVSAVGPELGVQATLEIDARGMIVLPGVIDVLD